MLYWRCLWYVMSDGACVAGRVVKGVVGGGVWCGGEGVDGGGGSWGGCGCGCCVVWFVEWGGFIGV